MTTAPTPVQQLETARAEVARLERQIAGMTCAERGSHRWKSVGGANCGCEGGNCSVPVHECEDCGDCDYGDNTEANEKRAGCAQSMRDFGRRLG